MNIADYLAVGAAGAVYFRAMLTSARDFESWKDVVGIGSTVGSKDTEWANSTRAHGPIPMRDPRIAALTALILLPMVLYSSLKEHEIYGFILCIGVGAFVSPLLIQTFSEPGPNDLTAPGTFIMKWLVGKIDVYIKTSFAFVMVWILTKIPLIGPALSTVANFAFPIVRQTDIEAAIIDASASVLLFIYIIRVTMFIVHGYAYATLVAIATSWIWIEYQYFFDKEIGGGESSVLPSFSQTVFLILTSDLILSFLSAAMNASGRKSER